MRFVRSLSRYAFQPFQKLARLAFGAYSFSTSLYSLKTFSTLEFLSARRCIRLQLVPRWNELRVGYFHYHRHFLVPTVSRTRPPCVLRVSRLARSCCLARIDNALRDALRLFPPVYHLESVYKINHVRAFQFPRLFNGGKVEAVAFQQVNVFVVLRGEAR